MTNRSNVQTRSLQQYKQYAQSTQQLNEALNSEIKQCYRQIDSLRQQLRKATSADSSRHLADSNSKVQTLQSLTQHQTQQLAILRNTLSKIENDLKSEQQANNHKSRQLSKAQEDLAKCKKELLESERKAQGLQTKVRLSEGEVARQAVLLRELQQVSVMSVVESRRREGSVVVATTGANQHKVKSLEGELKRSQEDNAWLKQMVADKAALEEMLMKQVNTVTNQRIAAEKIAKEAEGILTGVRVQLSQAKNELANCKQSLRQAQNKLVNSQRKFHILEQQYNKSKICGSENPQNVISQLKNELQFRNKTIAKLQKHLDALQAKANKLQAQNFLPPVEQQLELAANEIISLRKQMIILKTENQMLNKQNNELKIMLENAEQLSMKRSDSKTRTSMINSSTKSDNRLKIDYAEALKKNSQLVEINAKLQISRNELLAELQRLRTSQTQIDSYSGGSTQLKFSTLAKQNQNNLSNSVPSLKFSTSNKDLHQKKLWKKQLTPQQDYNGRINTVSYQTWMTLQKKIDNLRNQNEMLKKDLSFGALRN